MWRPAVTEHVRAAARASAPFIGRLGPLALALATVVAPGERGGVHEPALVLLRVNDRLRRRVPVRVRIDMDTFDLDLDALAGALTPRPGPSSSTRPTTRPGASTLPPPWTASEPSLAEASEAHGRSVYLLSDEAGAGHPPVRHGHRGAVS